MSRRKESQKRVAEMSPRNEPPKSRREELHKIVAEMSRRNEWQK